MTPSKPHEHIPVSDHSPGCPPDCNVTTDDIAACCEACVKTFIMVAQLHSLVDTLMNNPMAAAMVGGPPPMGVMPTFVPPKRIR